MKTNYLKTQIKQFTLGTIIMASTFLSLNSFAGDRVGNGGDAVAQHFFDIATRVSKVLKITCEDSLSAVCREENKLQNLIANVVTIYSEDTVEGENGKERDAVNNGIDSITVSRVRWEEMELSFTRDEKRVRLVIHEYLSILGLEVSDDYSVTNPLVQEMKNKMFDLSSVAGKYVKNSVETLEFSEPHVIRSGEHIMLYARSNKDAVCRLLTKSLDAKAVSYSTQGHVVAGRGFGIGVVKKNNRLKVSNVYLSTGSTVLSQITCNLSK